MIQIKRMFSTDNFKGTRNYINSQKKYEIIRTIIYFFISISLFAAGYITTKSRENLLTVVAVVGCLPACKSLVAVIMFFRYKSCPDKDADLISSHIGQLDGLFDLVFTSEKKNFVVSHLVVQGNNICGYSCNHDFPEKDFYTHIEGILKLDGHKNYTVKIFTDIQKYIERLDQLNDLETENKNIPQVLATLKAVSL